MFSAGMTRGGRRRRGGGSTSKPPPSESLGESDCAPERQVDWLHAGGTGEGPHEPVVNAADVVEVHAREKPNGITDYKLHHTYWAPVCVCVCVVCAVKEPHQKAGLKVIQSHPLHRKVSSLNSCPR